MVLPLVNCVVTVKNWSRCFVILCVASRISTVFFKVSYEKRGHDDLKPQTTAMTNNYWIKVSETSYFLDEIKLLTLKMRHQALSTVYGSQENLRYCNRNNLQSLLIFVIESSRTDSLEINANCVLVSTFVARSNWYWVVYFFN